MRKNMFEKIFWTSRNKGNNVFLASPPCRIVELQNLIVDSWIQIIQRSANPPKRKYAARA